MWLTSFLQFSMSFIPKDNDLLLKEKPVLCYYNRLSLPIITSYFQICLVAASQASWAEKLYAKIFSTAISNKLLKQILQGLGFFFESYHRKNKSKTWNISSGKAKHWCFETGIGILTCVSRMYILLALSIFIPREEYLISSEQHTF